MVWGMTERQARSAYRPELHRSTATVLAMLMARDRMTSEDVAAVLELPPSAVSKVRSGRRLLTAPELFVLADLFGVTADDFGPRSRFLTPAESSRCNESAARQLAFRGSSVRFHHAMAAATTQRRRCDRPLRPVRPASRPRRQRALT